MSYVARNAPWHVEIVGCEKVNEEPKRKGKPFETRLPNCGSDWRHFSSRRAGRFEWQRTDLPAVGAEIWGACRAERQLCESGSVRWDRSTHPTTQKQV